MTSPSTALPDYYHERPLNREFYRTARAGYLAGPEPRERLALSTETGVCIDVSAGEIVGVELVDGPQVVNLFAFNAKDSDERLWAHNTSSVEGAFLRRYSRVWSTMARFRPMLTVIDDTVVTQPTVGAVAGKHHFVIGGFGTRADWLTAGGSSDVASTWERFVAALATRDLDPHLLKDDICLFQKTAVDPRSQVLKRLPSDATAGDRVVFFVEFDLLLVFALSPYCDGAVSVDQVRNDTVRRVDFLRFGFGPTPLPWPYEDVPYPDMSLYLDEDGRRTDRPEATAGREVVGYRVGDEGRK
jgi:uncharacterized protein YcgI (DUF1989 family)